MNHERATNDVVLSAQGVSNAYGELEDLTDLTFRVRAGEILGLLGPNGEGKTTAIRVLSGYVVPLALDPELNAVSQRKMIAQTIQVTVLVGGITALLLGANAVSGERDQRSLESLLLTPLSRWQIVVGKLLAVLSVWVAMIPIAIPYVWLAARGTGLFAGALLLLIFPGTLLVGLRAGIGMLVSSLQQPGQPCGQFRRDAPARGPHTVAHERTESPLRALVDCHGPHCGCGWLPVGSYGDGATTPPWQMRAS